MSELNVTLNDFFGSVELTDHSFEYKDAEGKSANTLDQITSHFPGIAREYLLKQIDSVISETLKVSVVKVLAMAWSKNQELSKYLDKEKYPAGTKTIVPLFKHKIKSPHQPSLEITLGEKTLRKIKFEVECELEVEGAILTIQDAQIKEIQTSFCTGKGEIKCEGIKLKEVESKKIKLPGLIKLDKGEPIPVPEEIIAIED